MHFALKRFILTTLSVIVLISTFLIFYYLNHEANRSLLTVAFLDVGQGDSVFIETPNGNQVVIDSGATGGVVRQISKLLPFYDRNLVLLIATHYDLDHVGGFPEIFKRYSVEYYAETVVEDETEIFQEIKRTLGEKRINNFKLIAGDKIILDKENNIYLEVLWPDSNFSGDKNDSSVITRLIYDETEFLFTGDASKEIERKVLSAAPDKIESNVLKIGHHGSDTSTDPDFLGKVNPEYAVISAGHENRFGHPDESVIETLREREIEILETSSSGTIIFQSNGRELFLR